MHNPQLRFRASSRTRRGRLPGVSVTVKNDATGTAQEVVTDADGRYQATALEAGLLHSLRIAGGFQDRRGEERSASRPASR